MKGVIEHERFNKRRISWTIGTDGGTSYGSKRDAFGAFRPQSINRRRVESCIVDNSDVLSLTLDGRAFNDGLEVEIQEWGGAISLAWNEANTAYEATVPGLNAFIAARQGRQLRMSPALASGLYQLTVGSFLFDFGFTQTFGNLVPTALQGETITRLSGTTSGGLITMTLSNKLAANNIDVTYSGGTVTLAWNAGNTAYEATDPPFANYLASNLDETVPIGIIPEAVAPGPDPPGPRPSDNIGLAAISTGWQGVELDPPIVFGDEAGTLYFAVTAGTTQTIFSDLVETDNTLEFRITQSIDRFSVFWNGVERRFTWPAINLDQRYEFRFEHDGAGTLFAYMDDVPANETSHTVAGSVNLGRLMQKTGLSTRSSGVMFHVQYAGASRTVRLYIDEGSGDTISGLPEDTPGITGTCQGTEGQTYRWEP